MARITVEDCLAQVGNRFMLVELARKRSLQLLSGSPPLVEPEGDKPTVIALREIAERKITEDNIATFGVRDGNYKKEVEEQVTNDNGS